jgi:hypothetical protein
MDMDTELARRRAIGLAASAAAVAVGYPLLWRSWCLNWGATKAEAARQMPGDELLPSADLVTTRAVTINAPAKAIWPWLVQMGPGRGGAYTYDWIENLLGLDMHSSDEIIPEFQNLAIGDTQRLGEHGAVLRVEVLEPERALVLRCDDGAWVWAFGLYPRGDVTRLVSRNRITPPHPNPASKAFMLYVMEPGSLVMERKMLLGIKQRAETLARRAPAAAPRRARIPLGRAFARGASRP